MNKNLIQASNVTKILGSGPSQVRALDNVSLSLASGQLTVLMGPSGSGKTTLLSVLGCMLAPSEGTLEVCGIDTAGADSERLTRIRRQYIGFVFQSYHLFPSLTAMENVQMALDVRGERGTAARFRSRDMLARVGLAGKAGSFPRELSGGEQQRVAIARAIVAEPSVILADEPTGALDGANGQAVMSILSEIAKDRTRAVLVVTHDARLLSFADRIVSIEDGALSKDEPAGSNVYPMRSIAGR